MNNNLNNKHLEYSAIRSEANNKFTIFLQVPSQFKDKEIDVNFNPTDNKLEIKGPNLETHTTNQLSQVLVDRLKVEIVQIIFCDSDMTMIGKCDLEPKLPALKNKP